MWVPDNILQWEFRLHRWLIALWNLGQNYDDVHLLDMTMEMMMSDMEDLEAKIAAMEDEEKAVKSAVDGVKGKMAAMQKELDDMKAAAADNPVLKAWADRLGKVHDDIAADVAAIMVSGGPA